jgi:hypothetical protein
MSQMSSAQARRALENRFYVRMLLSKLRISAIRAACSVRSRAWRSSQAGEELLGALCLSEAQQGVHQL